MARTLSKHQKKLRDAKRRKLERQLAKDGQVVATTSKAAEAAKTPCDAKPSEGDTIASGGKADSGLDLIDDRHLSRDLKLVARAARNRWALSEEKRKAILEKAVSVAEGVGGGTVRDMISAFKAVVAADSADLQRDKLDFSKEQKAKPQEVHHTHDIRIGSVDERTARIDALAASLGIGGPAGPDGPGSQVIDVEPVEDLPDAQGTG